MTMNTTKKNLKKAKLRYNEYYDIQKEFDELYQRSKEGRKFTNLLNLITDKRNIELAYRTIKNNTGSNIEGTNKHTIKDIANLTAEEYVSYAKARITDYNPHKVRRVEIPKAEGGILSPLLSNIVLNELDWWISDQWETFEARHNYDIIRDKG